MHFKPWLRLTCSCFWPFKIYLLYMVSAFVHMRGIKVARMVSAVNILDIQTVTLPTLSPHRELITRAMEHSPLGRAVWVASVVRHFLVPKDFTQWDSIPFSCLECCKFFFEVLPTGFLSALSPEVCVGI